MISDDDDEEESEEEEDVIDLSSPAAVCSLHLFLGLADHIVGKVLLRHLMQWCPRSPSGSCITLACTAASLDGLSRGFPYSACKLSCNFTIPKGFRTSLIQGPHCVAYDVQVSQSQRPRRTASTKGPALRDALSEEESEEAIEEDDGDEDFTV